MAINEFTDTSMACYTYSPNHLQEYLFLLKLPKECSMAVCTHIKDTLVDDIALLHDHRCRNVFTKQFGRIRYNTRTGTISLICNMTKMLETDMSDPETLTKLEELISQAFAVSYEYT